ncbi:MAG: FHA domain-containing protein [Clostridiaceae bacterium]|nr:FHA domain-containing protein [Clostridiaceae bacterium]
MDGNKAEKLLFTYQLHSDELYLPDHVIGLRLLDWPQLLVPQPTAFEEADRASTLFDLQDDVISLQDFVTAEREKLRLATENERGGFPLSAQHMISRERKLLHTVARIFLVLCSYYRAIATTALTAANLCLHPTAIYLPSGLIGAQETETPRPRVYYLPVAREINYLQLDTSDESFAALPEPAYANSAADRLALCDLIRPIFQPLFASGALPLNEFIATIADDFASAGDLLERALRTTGHADCIPTDTVKDFIPQQADYHEAPMQDTPPGRYASSADDAVTNAPVRRQDPRSRHLFILAAQVLAAIMFIYILVQGEPYPLIPLFMTAIILVGFIIYNMLRFLRGTGVIGGVGKAHGAMPTGSGGILRRVNAPHGDERERPENMFSCGGRQARRTEGQGEPLALISEFEPGTHWEMRGKRLWMVDKYFTIGSAPDDDYIISDPEISEAQVTLRRQGANFFAESSREGTHVFVDTDYLSAGEVYPLPAAANIRLGRHKLWFMVSQ